MHNAKTGATYHAFLYDNEVVTDLGTLPGHNESQAVAINNLDPPTVVGYSHNNVTGPKRAVQWSEGVAIDLEVPIGPRNEASGVNDKNQIVGWMGVSWPSIASASLPFLWSDGTTIQLPLPLSAINGAADSINNIGDVIGNYRRSNPIGSGTVTRGLMWQHGKIVEFTPFSGFAHSTTSGVNDRTQVVGHFSNGGSDFTAFLWQNNSIYTLESLIPAHSTFTGVTVHSINNNSEIVGTATLIGSGTTVGVVLLPIPPVIGDVDCDQKVNVPDLLTVIHSWGACAPPAFGINCPADLDSDSNVGLNDLLTVVLNWAP